MSRPLALLGAACGGKLSGVVDFDNTRDFDSYSRFGFLEDEKPLERAQTDTRKQVRKEIEEQLQAKGYRITTPGKAQVIVIYHVGSHTKTRMAAASSSRFSIPFVPGSAPIRIGFSSAAGSGAAVPRSTTRPG